MKRAAIVFLAAMTVAGAAQADGGDGCRELTSKTDSKVAIAACTAALQAKDGKSNDDIAADYKARGKAYDRAGRYKDAITDYATAFALSPQDGSILDAEAVAYEDDGQLDQAIALYRQEIDLARNTDPGDPYFYGAYYLGRDEFQAGSYADAASDLKAFLTNQDLDYSESDFQQHYQRAVLWLHLARFRTGTDDTSELSENVKPITLTAWPGPIFELYLGQSTPAKVLAATPKKSSDARCLATYWVGEYDLAQKDDTGKSAKAGKRLMQQALKACGRGTEEHYTAELVLAGKR